MFQRERTQVVENTGVMCCVILWALLAPPLWALLAPPGAIAAGAQTPAEAARHLYNQGRYDQALTAADRLRAVAATANLGALIAGRARIERFRTSGDEADVQAARQALAAVKPSRLVARDQTDYLVGLGELQYLDDTFDVAAELFEVALDRIGDANPRDFNRVFDWWAASLDRHARSSDASARDLAYARLRDRSLIERARRASAVSVSYWLVVALRSLGELDRAWAVARTAWITAALDDDQGPPLRADLDRLVNEALIPERVREMGGSDRDRERNAAALHAAWETMKAGI